MDIKFDADTKVADSQRQYEMLKAGYEAEVNTKVSSDTATFLSFHTVCLFTKITLPCKRTVGQSVHPLQIMLIEPLPQF